MKFFLQICNRNRRGTKKVVVIVFVVVHFFLFQPNYWDSNRYAASLCLELIVFFGDFFSICKICCLVTFVFNKIRHFKLLFFLKHIFEKIFYFFLCCFFLMPKFFFLSDFCHFISLVFPRNSSEIVNWRIFIRFWWK